MNNNVLLIGRLVKDPEVKTNEKAKFGYIKLAVTRNYKNENGEYESDFIDVTCFSHVAEYLSLYCKQGDLVGIKGRLQNSSFEKDGETIYKTSVVAESVSILAHKKNEETEEK